VSVPTIRRQVLSWIEVEKREIVAETEAPGALVSVVARRRDINANLLFKWKLRSLARLRIRRATNFSLGR